MTTDQLNRASNGPTFTTLVSEIVQGVRNLAVAHGDQLKNELREPATQARNADINMAAGILLAAIGMIFLLVTVELVLVEVLLWPPWVASLVIGVILLAAGAAWFLIGRRLWSDVHFIPSRTLNSIRESFLCLTNGKPR
jgi:Flp pilus assembly protein TadB